MPTRYEPIRELRSGSLTRNVVARGSDGPVMLRILHPYIAEDPVIRPVFLDYARELLEVRHPSIVATYDLDESDGSVTLVQEYCDGPSADEGRVEDLGVLLARCADAAGALAWLHGTGRLHRAVRPGNVHLTGEGNVKLGDFRAAPVRNLLGLSTTTTMVAEPHFTPPEVYLGRGWETRGDVYSLATLMYFWATGRYPLKPSDAVYGVDAASVMTDVRELRPELPEWFGALLRDALGPVDERPGSDEMAERLGNRHGGEKDDVEECLHCFRPIPADLPVCPYCGGELPDLVASGDASLVILRLGEREEIVAPLIRRIRILSGDPDYKLNLITGDARMYSKAERANNLRLPCRLVDGIDRRCAEELAVILNSGKELRVKVRRSDQVMRRVRRYGPVFQLKPRRRRRAGRETRALLTLDIPAGRYSVLAAGFLRELYRCLAQFPVIGEEETASLAASFRRFFEDLEAQAALVGGADLGGLYWGAARGSDEAAQAVFERLTRGQRELERRLFAVEEAKKGMAAIRRGERRASELSQILRTVLPTGTDASLDEG